MNEKIAEKILEEIKSLKVGQEKIIGQVDELNAICRNLDGRQAKLEEGQKNIIETQEKHTEDIEILKLIAMKTWDRIDAVLMDMETLDAKTEKLKKVQ